ncbi:MAG: LapA family protein [Desulfobacterales bacterium]|nr:LapA family protein [Desulfobacterales bacterium]
MNYKLLFSSILAGLVVIFIIQNIAVTEIKFLFWKFAMSRSLMFFFLLLVGFVIGWLLNSYRRHKKTSYNLSQK